jgi:hypothetical protein
MHEAMTRVLEDYCKDASRGRLWAAVAEVMIVLGPVVAELIAVGAQDHPRSAAIGPVMGLLVWGLGGVVVAVLGVAMGISVFGRSGLASVWVEPEQVDDLARLLTRVQELRAREFLDRLDSVREEAEPVSVSRSTRRRG